MQYSCQTGPSSVHSYCWRSPWADHVHPDDHWISQRSDVQEYRNGPYSYVSDCGCGRAEELDPWCTRDWDWQTWVFCHTPLPRTAHQPEWQCAGTDNPERDVSDQEDLTETSTGHSRWPHINRPSLKGEKDEMAPPPAPLLPEPKVVRYFWHFCIQATFPKKNLLPPVFGVFFRPFCFINASFCAWF